MNILQLQITKCIALITGIHPRETLSIEPEIQAARQFGNDNVKIINYKVTVTDSPDDYEKGRANGESLVHDYVNPMLPPPMQMQ